VRLIPTAIDAVHIVEFEEYVDDRGFFARAFCAAEFEAAGLVSVVAQCNVSFNHVAGTVRGLHLQTAAAPEAKLVRCTRGAINDVIVDMRPDSPTLGQHLAFELTADNHRALYIPPLFAHAYQTLVDATEVHYQVSHPYTPNTERGIRHDDPVLGLEWPLVPTAVSDKDMNWPLLGGPEGLATLAREGTVS
jgi:dTDP-4-dehydrorhamnose 3,5-epimerase